MPALSRKKTSIPEKHDKAGQGGLVLYDIIKEKAKYNKRFFIFGKVCEFS